MISCAAIMRMRMTLPLLRFVGALPIPAARGMAGGPRTVQPLNPTRKAGSKPVAKMTRARKQKSPSTPPKDNHRFVKFKDHPVPKKLRPFQNSMESYIVDTWLPSFQDGARLKKLQRDVAFRMDKSPGKLLSYEHLVTVVGAMERKGLLRTRANTRGVLIIMQPEKEGEELSEGSEEANT